MASWTPLMSEGRLHFGNRRYYRGLAYIHATEREVHDERRKRLLVPLGQQMRTCDALGWFMTDVDTTDAGSAPVQHAVGVGGSVYGRVNGSGHRAG